MEKKANGVNETLKNTTADVDTFALELSRLLKKHSNEKLLPVESKLAPVELPEEHFLVMYPPSGGSKTVSSGSVLIDFWEGTVRLGETISSDNLSKSLQKTGKDAIHSLFIRVSKSCKIKIGELGEKTITGDFKFKGTPVKNITLTASDLTSFNFSLLASTNPIADFDDESSDLDTLTQNAAFGTAAKGLALFGKYEATQTTYDDGDAVPVALDANGNIKLSSDIQIGAVELKDADTDNRANIKAANTARTTGTIVVATQPIDAAGAVLSTSALALEAGNLASVKTAVEVIDNFISGSRGLVTEDNSASIKTAVELIDNFISGARGLVTEDNSASIKTAVELIDNFISGTRGLVTEDNSASIKTAVEIIDNFISGSRGLVTEDNSAAIKTAVEAAKAVAQIQDWTAVAQNTVAKSAVYDFSGKHAGILHIQAALDTTTAHTGTRMIVQISSNTTGDEDWQNLTEFIALIGTAVTDLIENNPLAAGATSITLTAHALTVLGKLLFIEDGTLTDSEIVLESAQAANTITLLDGTTNAHALNTAIFNVAMTQDISIPDGVNRIRLVVDNSYDADGSTLNYKVRISTEV